MKNVLLFVFIMYCSPAAWSRTLACSLSENGWNKVLATQEVNLDVKPNAKQDHMATTERKEIRMRINSDEGVLAFWETATWYSGFSNGFRRITNLSDRFPEIDVGVFFYRTGDAKPSYIAIRSGNAPGFNAYAATSEERYVLDSESSFGTHYHVHCVVRN